MLIDSHCHLSSSEFDLDRKAILKEAEGKFYALIESTLDLETADKVFSLFDRQKLIYFSLGFHPYYADKFSSESLKVLSSYIDSNPKIKAVGETGLDYKSKIGLEIQEKMFLSLLDLAKQADLPLIIHNRGFEDKIIRFLKENKVKKAVFHCFSYDKSFVEKISGKGFFASFSANITFKKADSLREAVKEMPLERILTETDSPFLAPQVVRGKRNSPLYIPEVVKTISQVKGVSEEKVISSVLSNAKSLYRI